MPDVKSIVGRPQPHKGEHTREILAESGYTEQEIDCLLQDGVVDVGQTSKAKL
jgi:crotonobetainyl-CoA:carnitine CoA-transferase CaiB-like acyl-CoA transferase